MHFNALRRIIPALYATSLTERRVSLELVSSPGLGKSEFVADTVQEFSTEKEPWGFATLFLATMTPSDLLGYMVPERRAFGEKNCMVSAFTMPPWMLTREGKPLTEYKRGVLFLDEYGQGEADVKRASAELLLNGQLGPWRVPPGWTIIAASNRAKDRSGVTKSFDFVINRRLEIHVQPDLQSWVDWAVMKSVDPAFIAFASQNVQVVFEGKVPEEQGPWCTPRSLVMLDTVIKSLGHFDPKDPATCEIGAGLIGAGATSQLFAFLRLRDQLPLTEDILKKPKETKVPTSPDACMLVCYQLAGIADTDNITPIVTYIERLPKEFSFTFAKAACRRVRTLVNTKAMGEWCVRNHALMSAISDIR